MAGIVRIDQQGAGIDAAKFGHGVFLLVGVSSSLFFGKTPPARRIPIRRGKGARSARPKAGPLRRRTVMRQPSHACRVLRIPSMLILSMIVPPVFISPSFIQNSPTEFRESP